MHNLGPIVFNIPGRFLMVFFLMCVSVSWTKAQLYPGLEGEQLADAIRDDYTPSALLDDTMVKDTLYAKVFKVGDSVACIYSGLSRFLPAGVDPSQWLFGNGQEIESINLEHGWPQAKGAGEGTDGNTNMYHLFPSRTAINSDRANFPFAEIADQQTQKWYFKDKEMASKPVSNINAYSEFFNGSFEPRESVKGDIARAMFYFWTIYREDALEADPFFFGSQLEHLCAWHQQDPADEAEISRNVIIAQYQDGKHNPFVVDCSLVKRAYCSQLADCVIVGLVEGKESHDSSLRFLLDTRQFTIQGENEHKWTLRIFDQTGRNVFIAKLTANESSQPVELPPGFYIASALSSARILTIKCYIP